MSGRQVPTRVAPSVVEIVGLFPRTDIGQDKGDIAMLFIRGNQAKSERYLKFSVGPWDSDDWVIDSNMHTRFHLDPPKDPPKEDIAEFVHVRCAYNNKYLVAVESGVKEGKPMYLMGTADEPEEDLSKPSCTLFTVHFLVADIFYPQFKNKVSFCTPIGDHSVGFYCDGNNYSPSAVFIVDATNQMFMPKYVVFKGENSLYLTVDASDYLQFSSSDVNEVSARFSTFNYSSGRVRLQSVANGRFMRVTADKMWIYADATSISDGTIFKALKFSNFIALQPETGKFCMSINQGNIVWLGVGDSITEKAKLWLEEPVVAREIYNIQYHRIAHSRIYDTTKMNMVTATAVNMTSEKNTIKSSLAITTRESSKWEATDTFKVGASLKFNVESKVSVLGFVEDKLGLEAQLGFDFTHATNWGTSSETEKKQEIEYQVTVPVNKKVTLTVIATQAKCDVPFSYTQKDTLPNGEIRIYNYDDGLYSGMNSFDLHYETKEEDVILQKDEEEMETPSKKKKRTDVLHTSSDQERRIITSKILIN